jgi:hypothetical protein
MGIMRSVKTIFIFVVLAVWSHLAPKALIARQESSSALGHSIQLGDEARTHKFQPGNALRHPLSSSG